MRANVAIASAIAVLVASGVVGCHRESVPPRREGHEGGACMAPGATEMGPCPPFAPKNLCEPGRHIDCVERRDDGSCWYAHSQPACEKGIDCKAPAPTQVACP